MYLLFLQASASLACLLTQTFKLTFKKKQCSILIYLSLSSIEGWGRKNGRELQKTKIMNTKLKAALKMSAQNPDGKVTLGQNIINSVQAAPTYFPTGSLPIPLASLQTSITNLHNAILATGSGASSSISNMHEKERIVISLFGVLRAYVEMQANNTPDPKTVIEAAGMVALSIGGSNPVSELTLSAIGNGIVQVSVPRQTGEAAFTYQYSTDAGATWIEFENSKMATIQLKNQTPASILHFRYAAIGKTKGAFSQSKSLIVL